MRIIQCMVFVLSVFAGFGQDLIIEKSGHRIFCEIVKDDSLSLSYIRTGNNVINDILKRDVERYYYNSKSSLAPKPVVVAGDDYYTAPPDIKPEKKDLFLLDISAGVAIPVRDFGNPDADDSTAGLAKRGLNAGVTTAVKLSRHIGLSLAYIYQFNSLDHEQVRSAYSAVFPTESFTTSATKWVSSGFYGGFYFTFPLPSDGSDGLFSIDLNLMAGFSKFTSPQITISGKPKYTYGTVQTIWRDEAEARSLALLGGLSLRYKATKDLSVSMSFSYLEAKPVFMHVKWNSTVKPPMYVDGMQHISTLNVKLGLMLLLK